MSCLIFVQALQLERSPTRAKLETEIARTKNAPRGKSLCKENSPSSRVSDSQQHYDSDWRTSMEKNIQLIMQHLQIPTNIPTKACIAKSDSGEGNSSDHGSGSPSFQKSEDVDDGITQLIVRTPSLLFFACIVTFTSHIPIDVVLVCNRNPRMWGGPHRRLQNRNRGMILFSTL